MMHLMKAVPRKSSAARNSSHAKEWHMKREAQAGATLSKPEAVWRAIEELGYQAEVKDILDYVRTKFGIDADSPPETQEMPSQPPRKPAAPPVSKPATQRKPRP